LWSNRSWATWRALCPISHWLQRMRELCTAYGVVLIFDEVKTGFRVAQWRRAGVFWRARRPGCLCQGDGQRLSRFGGGRPRRDHARGGAGRVAHGGTYCGNVVAASAAAATLEMLEEQPVILATIFARGQELMDGIHAILNRAGVPHVRHRRAVDVQRAAGRRSVAPADYRAYASFDGEMFGKLGERADRTRACNWWMTTRASRGSCRGATTRRSLPRRCIMSRMRRRQSSAAARQRSGWPPDRGYSRRFSEILTDYLAYGTLRRCLTHPFSIGPPMRWIERAAGALSTSPAPRSFTSRSALLPRGRHPCGSRRVPRNRGGRPA
jgi:hypothetical protein